MNEPAGVRAWGRATEFEFRYRFWLLGAVFFVGFQWYAVDHVSAGVWLAGLLRGHAIDQTEPADRRVLEAVFAGGALLAALAAALRTWAAAYLESAVVHHGDLHAERLVAEGPYRHTRNPLYLGGILLGAGVGLAASRAGWVFIVAGLTVLYYRMILREEAALLATQSDGYRSFLHAVPRLLPSLRARIPAGGQRPQWGQAWAGELFMWFFAVCMGLYAATLSMRVLMISTAVAMAFAVGSGAIIARRSSKSGTAAVS